MKNIILIISTVFISLLLTTSCNEPQDVKENTHDHNHHQENNSGKQETEHSIHGFKLASNRDTICHMHVDENVKDTIMLEEQVLGFCSSDCREAFLQILKDEHKRW
ncbi:MAG: hypothetical protein ACK5NK_12565 [Niabella sp.]